jgi:hypothetical protein
LRPIGRRILKILASVRRSFDGVAPNHTQPLGDWKRLPAIHQERGIHINASTAATRWTGERMDYGLATDAGFQSKTACLTSCCAEIPF